MAAMDSGNYVAADSLFRTVIATSSGTDRARESAKNLIPVTRELSMDFSSLKSYYAQTPALHADSITDHLVYRLMNACDLCSENYDSAVVWFENDILNPASVADSVYSLIDLGDTYLLMQSDSGLKSVNNLHGSLTMYIPHDRQEYSANRKEWIDILFRENHGSQSGKDGVQVSYYEVLQNTPNPFSSVTDIQFFSRNAGVVEYSVTNIMGQILVRYNQPYSIGKNMVSIDLSGAVDGVYLVSFMFEDRARKVVKIIKQP